MTEEKYDDSSEIETEEMEVQMDSEDYDAISSETKKVSEEDLVEKYQKHFDKKIAFKLLKKLRKATRNKPKAIPAGRYSVVVTWSPKFKRWLPLLLL